MYVDHVHKTNNCILKYFCYQGWKRANYPLVPGHECIGKVTTTGASVKHLKVGDRVGVSPVRRACGDCANCKEEYGQYCDEKVATYNGSYEGYALHGVSDTFIV